MPGLKAQVIAVLATASVAAGGLLSPAQGSPSTPTPPTADVSVPQLTVSSDEPPVPSLAAPTVATCATTPVDVTEPRPVAVQFSELQSARPDRECFGYDFARRLISAWSGCVREEPGPPDFDEPDPYNVDYSYSRIGQLTEVRDNRADQTWSYDYRASGQASVRPHAVREIQIGAEAAPADASDVGIQPAVYTYNGNGNMTKRTISGATTELRWDQQNRLTRMLGAQAQRYVYDADATRLIRRSDTQTTLYLDGTELHLDGTEVTGTRYYTAGAATVGIRTPSGLWRTTADHQGSAQVTVADTDDRVIVARSRYLPYGAARTAPPLPTDRRFLSAPHDDTGLVHLGARFYDPAIGRFISPDPLLAPLDAATLDPYAYATNNPITYSDPTGLAPTCGDTGCGTGPGSPSDPVGAPPTAPDYVDPCNCILPDQPTFVGAFIDAAHRYRLEQHIESPALSQYDRAAIVLNVCRATPGLCSDQYEHFVGALFFAYSDAAIGSDFGIYAGAAIGAGAGMGSGGRKSAGLTGSSSHLVPGGGLAAHEAAGGHTLAKHIGKTDSDLLTRLQDQPRIPSASAFKDRATAERSIADLLSSETPRIQAWLSLGTKELVVPGHAAGPIGRSIARGAAGASDVRGVLVVLRADPTMPIGYRIHSAYPQ